MFQAYDIAVPQGVIASTAVGAGKAAVALGGKAMVKAQVLTGGRGKAGAIRTVSSSIEAETAAKQILTMSVKDFAVRQVLVTERLDIQTEYYTGLTIDSQARSVVLIVSAAGGMEIEQIAVHHPEKIRRFVMSPEAETELKPWLSESFLNPSLADQVVVIVKNMYRLFREKDCSLVEINPLAQTEQGQLIAADAKIVFDDNALYLHPEIALLSNPEEYTADERRAKTAGLSYVSLSGRIGCMVNGAGLAMATMDGIKLAGGSAANFLDVGGSSNPQKVLDAMGILLDNEQVKVILINIFGGITRCDDIARGILQARNQLDITIPVVIRLIGTNEDKGRTMLCEAGLIAVRSMSDAIRQAVNCELGGAKL